MNQLEALKLGLENYDLRFEVRYDETDSVVIV